MARPIVQDEGADFDWDLSLEDELLLSNIADLAQHPSQPAADTDSVVDTSSIGPSIYYNNGAQTSHESTPHDVQRLVGSGFALLATSQKGADLGSLKHADLRYPDLSVPLSAIETPPISDIEDAPGPTVAEDVATQPLRSPLARFRTFPRKPLSVTDFSSLVWCEQQHEYTLTRLGGRKPRTAAMKGGTKIHEQLEREVHRTVRVEVMTKEDAFGLKIWNVIQGLRTLRDDGLTRELEVWGIVDGHVVNGLIDGLSVQHPDPQFEHELLSMSGSQEEADRLNDSHKITDFFDGVNPSQELKGPARKVWLFDVKTRGHWSLPSKVHLRPAMVQLYLYHRFLSDMAAGKLDYLYIYRRYGLDPDLPFSDLFLAQIGSLHDEVFQDSTSTLQSPVSTAQASEFSMGTEATSIPATASSSAPEERLRYHSLRQLIPLLKDELKQTFPRGEASLGQVVSLEYRYRGLPKRRKDVDIDLIMEDEEDENVGALIGHHNFNVADEILPSCVDDHMEWWRGERPANGVPVEEADKCRYCQFADICEWRAENHSKLLEESRQRRAKVAAAAKRSHTGKME